VDKFPAEFLGHLGDLLQPLYGHSATGHPQSHGEEILAALLDEAAGLEVAQFDLCCGGFL